MDMKRNHWKLWFEKPIPMLHDLSPRQAAQTKQGRRLLDELFQYYDAELSHEQSPNAFNVNVPTKWAKWKLGYGPGSAREFAEEETIFNSIDPNQPTQRAQRHDTKLDKKKKRVFVPLRCEYPGCDVSGANVKKCSRCSAVWYCSRVHQVGDFPRHKQECKYLANRTDLEFKYFKTGKELEKFPLGSPPEVYDNERCFICHSHADEVKLGRTPCCNLVICDNQHEYEHNSYSRDHCLRSHMHYTKCHTHHYLEHKGDWRECSVCNAMEDGNVRPFATTNGFNYTPTLEEHLPRGSFLTGPCDGCTKNRILPGHDACTHTPDGSIFCLECHSHSL